MLILCVFTSNQYFFTVIYKLFRLIFTSELWFALCSPGCGCSVIDDVIIASPVECKSNVTFILTR